MEILQDPDASCSNPDYPASISVSKYLQDGNEKRTGIEGKQINIQFTPAHLTSAFPVCPYASWSNLLSDVIPNGPFS